MYIDFGGLTNTLTWIVASAVAISVAYRGVSFGRAFISGVFRKRALWIAALGIASFIQAVPGYVTPIHDFTIEGLPFFEIAWFTLFFVYLAFVDSTIMVALQMDFFHRDTLRWRKGRSVVFLVLGILVAAILLVAVGVVQNPSSSPVFTVPFVVSAFIVVPYSGAALFMGARRTPDRTLKRHLVLLALVFVLYISHFFVASISSNNPTWTASVLDDSLVLAGVYVLYRAVMTLSVMGHLETDSGRGSPKGRGTKRVAVASAVVLVALLALVVYTQASSTPPSGPWVASTGYPLQSAGNHGVIGQSCVDDVGYVYCVGGADPSVNPSSQAYSATFSASGVGAWLSSTGRYPLPVTGHSCGASSGFLYCIGGAVDTGGDDTSLSYFAPISSGTIGSWTPTTSFPIAVDSQACVTSAAYIYCIGGNAEPDGTNATSDLGNSAWYASLSSGGIGTWSRTTSYPQGAFLPACAASDGYVYCIGGVARSPSTHGGVNYFGLSNTQGEVYYAPLSSDGIGTWTATTSYPIQVALPSCVASSGHLYCIGGEQSGGADANMVFVAPISASGLGSWHRVNDYPAGILTTCLASGGNLACLGGFVYDTCSASISNLYCLDGAEGTFEISSSVYYIPLSLLTATPG